MGRAEGLAAIPVVWAIFPVLHASHGAGFATGLVKYVLRPDWAAPEHLASVDRGQRPPSSRRSCECASYAPIAFERSQRVVRGVLEHLGERRVVEDHLDEGVDRAAEHA